MRFNKDGSLLAVTSENGIKILANPEGFRLVRTQEGRNYETSRGQADAKVRYFLTFQEIKRVLLKKGSEVATFVHPHSLPLQLQYQ